MKTNPLIRLSLLGLWLVALTLSPLHSAESGPLVISSGPLLGDGDGWRTRGMPRVERVADTGDRGWLLVWSHTPEPDVGLDPTSGRIVARVLKAREDGIPDIGSSTSFPPVELADTLAINQQLAAVRGIGGAWAVWQSPTSVLAQWMSSATGRPEGETLVLGPVSVGGTLHAAGDGTTAWVGWAPRNFSGGLRGVTLSAQGGPPRITGRFELPGLTRFNNEYALAARGGFALVTEVGLPESSTSHSTRTRLLNATGETIGAEQVLTGPTPDVTGNLYGVLSYGSGWMIVWAQMLTPMLPGRIVYGRVLAADGTADPAEPVQALFVEPIGAMSARGVASADGTGVIAIVRDLAEPTFAQAVVVQPGQPLNVIQLGDIQPFRYLNPEPGLAIGFSGSRLALLSPRGNWRETPTFFTQEFTLADTSATIARWPVSRGPGLQEEPALAWIPGQSVVAWQQISTTTSTPEIVVRQRGPDGQASAPDLVVPRPAASSLSSPSLAANGNRLLLVARLDQRLISNAPNSDGDDVVGVFIENNRAVSQPFLIAGGPGSQRAARVAAWGDGFCVVWREETNLPTPELLYRIRCTFFNRDGTLVSPNGLTLAASVEELSSPTVATHGTSVAVAWRHLRSGLSSIEAVTLVGSSPDVGPTATIFAEPFFARSPDILWDGQAFAVTARLRNTATNVDTLGLARLELGGNRATLLPPIDRVGREPSLASLGAAGTAVFWLNQENGADSSSLWMAIRDTTGTTSAPQQVLRGRFDRDTLVARGDGHGRVMLAAHSNAFGDEGIRCFIVAPGVTDVPAVEHIQVLPPSVTGARPTFAFRWQPNVLFPARLLSVQASHTLTQWDTVPESLGEVSSSTTDPPTEALFRTLNNLPNPAPATPFFRLRAVLAE